MDEFIIDRMKALDAKLDAIGYAGSRRFRGPVLTILIDPPDDQAQAIIDAHNWTDAGELTDNRAAAVELAGGGSDPLAIGTRAMTAFAATRDNDQAEAFAALLDLLNVTPAALAERIALRRQTTPATPGAPTPDGVVFSATRRLGESTVRASVVGYIAAGAGDPVGGG
jgi:hypothetical protein